MIRSKSLSWRLKLADFISGGLVRQLQRKAESSKAKLEKIQIDIENLKKQLLYSKRENDQIKAQLLMAKGFHAELGETQLKLKETSEELLKCQQQLKQKQAKIETSTTQDLRDEGWYQQLQRTVEVIEVKRLPPGDFESLWGFGIASPQAETTIAGGSIIFQGWVLGKKALATNIRISYKDQVLLETPINLPSPGITQYYPDIASAGNSGFETSLSVVGIPDSAELEIQALLENQEIVNLSIISLQRK